jgi:hypothetical protein
MKYALLAGLVLVISLFAAADTASAKAIRYCLHGGYCLPGTCIKFEPARRVQYACNVANCSAANCPY